MTFKLRIGSRPSALALAQANLIKHRLEQMAVGIEAEIVSISTSGDKMATASLARVGGKGLFIRELEQALSDRHIDIAVHSMKDLPAVLAPQYRIAAVPERENPHDALIMRGGGGWNELQRSARLGTSSTRRRLEALRLRPDLNVMPLRGNVDTRLRRLELGDFDAIILAIAGLRRLQRCAGINLAELDECDFVPSGGQGALAIEALRDGAIGGSCELQGAVDALNDACALAEVSAERAFLATIGASCVSPVGVKATASSETLRLHALLFSEDGAQSLTDKIAEPHHLVVGPEANLAAIGQAGATIGAKLGQRMLNRGAGDLIGRE